jgi:arylsulfatase A-like enzyme
VVETALVQAPDMFATLADIAGAGSDNYQDGVSIKPLFSTSSTEKRAFVYTEQFGNTNTSKDGFAIRNSKYKYVQLSNQGNTDLLFDISADPYEQNDLLKGILSQEAQTNFDQLKVIKEGIK